MKNIIRYFILSFCFLLIGCEEVIPLKLDTAPAKLVIEASIVWKKDTNGKSQKIKLSTTTDYYSNTPNKVSGATVIVKNSDNMSFSFVENSNTGEYKCENFVPVIGEEYTLTVIYEGATYTATEKMQAVSPINRIEQNNQGGFTGKNIELKAYFEDPKSIANYYLFRYTYSSQVTSSFYVGKDEFFDGNEFFSISQTDKIKVGDKVEINHYGISKTYFNYMEILVSIAGNSGGGPFQSPPATVRGNIKNTTNPDNYPLGYFTLSEYDSTTYTVK